MSYKRGALLQIGSTLCQCIAYIFDAGRASTNVEQWSVFLRIWLWMQESGSLAIYCKLIQYGSLDNASCMQFMIIIVPSQIHNKYDGHTIHK